MPVILNLFQDLANSMPFSNPELPSISSYGGAGDMGWTLPAIHRRFAFRKSGDFVILIMKLQGSIPSGVPGSIPGGTIDKNVVRDYHKKIKWYGLQIRAILVKHKVSINFFKFYSAK
jgi:hypothetical protein